MTGEMCPVDSEQAVIFSALAKDFAQDHYKEWPLISDHAGIASQILYGLMTGYPVVLPEEKPAYDDQHWLQLYQAITQKTVPRLRPLAWRWPTIGSMTMRLMKYPYMIRSGFHALTGLQRHFGYCAVSGTNPYRI